MSTFLHTPARTPEHVREMVSACREEDEHLEFKATLNEEEVVGEAAAFANGLGGDLVIGVYHKTDGATGRDRASGWSQESQQLADKEGHVRNMLRVKLLPEELYGLLEVRVHPVDEGPPQKHVVVVNVPPWPHGIAAYRTSANPDQAQYKFPFRVESHTRFGTIEEVMRITGGQRRPLYLKALALFDEGRNDLDKSRLVFASVVQVSDGLCKGEFPLHEPDESHGTLREVTPDTLLLTMRGADKVDTSLRLGGPTGLVQGRPLDVRAEQELTIPLELVRAIWRGGPPHYHLQLALEGIVEWRWNRWGLVTGSVHD